MKQNCILLMTTVTLFAVPYLQAASLPRVQQRFDAGWRFYRGEVKGAEAPNYSDLTWRKVDLPHDYSIEDLPPLNAGGGPSLAVGVGDWKFQLGDNPAWKDRLFDDTAWDTVRLPTHWSTHTTGRITGMFGWYRRHITIPPEMRGKDILLLLGKVDDADETFVNGMKVGGMGSFPPNYTTAWTISRRYLVPANLLKSDGTDVVSVRDYNGEGDAGIYEAAQASHRSGPFDSESVGGTAQGFTTGGVGWYRKTFSLPAAWNDEHVSMTFDGVYMNAQFWLNGHLLGAHPYGYTSFTYDLTPYIRTGGTSKNMLAVRVDSSGQTSRWYSGSGIYRHVWLTVTHAVHVAPWGVTVTTSPAVGGKVIVNLITNITNGEQAPVAAAITQTVLDSSGKPIGSVSAIRGVEPGPNGIKQAIAIDHPTLWSPDSPTLYRLRTTVSVRRQVVDEIETPFGIRSITVDAAGGLMLNGQPLKLRGGCVHHDNGPLGSRTYDRAEERRVELLKAAGFNAIRTSHNPPSPAFLDACDRLGMLVLDEAFDCWHNGKNGQDYHLYFDEWWKRDTDSMVQRDRNHPSVVLWSIGNEIPEQNSPEGAERAAMLAAEVRLQDPTRPVTEATNPDADKLDPLLEHLDVAGYNYAAGRFPSDHANHPQRVFAQTESFPGAAFDAWMTVLDHPYAIGDFVWTALDYLGEAGIGRAAYPSDSNGFLGDYPTTVSGCGDLDITGVRKPQSYYRGVLWNTGPQVAAFVDAVAEGEPGYHVSGWGWPDERPSWTWPGSEGKNRTVRVYARTPNVKLLFNGRDLGQKETTRGTRFTATFTVPYAPGELTAIGLDAAGKEQARWTLQTTGRAASIALNPDRAIIAADGEDLAYVSVELQDAQGRLDPNANDLLHFALTGPGEIVAVGTGDPRSDESFQQPQRHAFRGRCLVIIKSSGGSGPIHLTAIAPGLTSATATFTASAKAAAFHAEPGE